MSRDPSQQLSGILQLYKNNQLPTNQEEPHDLYQLQTLQQQQNIAANNQSEVRNSDDQSFSFNSTMASQYQNEGRVSITHVVNQITLVQARINERINEERREMQQQRRTMMEMIQQQRRAMIEMMKNQDNRINKLENQVKEQFNQLKKMLGMMRQEQMTSELIGVQSNQEHSSTPESLSSYLKSVFKQNINILEEKIEDYGINDRIGSGQYGIVYKIKQKNSNLFYALKKIQKAKLFKQGAQLQKKVLNQISNLKQLNNSKIVKLIQTFEDEQNYYIQMEYGGQYTLRNIMPNLHLAQKYNIYNEILEAVRQIHAKKIVHMDIKPENIVMNTSIPIKLKLCDFGQSLKLDTPNIKSKFLHGTLRYNSPQLINNQYFNEKTDIFSLGVLLFELLHGRLPFGLTQFDNFEQCKQKITYNQLDISQQPEIQIFRDILMLTLEKKQHQRITIEELIRKFNQSKIFDELIKQLKIMAGRKKS